MSLILYQHNCWAGLSVFDLTATKKCLSLSQKVQKLTGQTHNIDLKSPQLDQDLRNFDIMSNMIHFATAKSFNIKRVIYRSITLFVSALGRSNGIREHSSFGIIDELKRRNAINENEARNLSLAVAVACHIRLVHYSSKNRQDDDIYREDESDGREKLKELFKIVTPIRLLYSLTTTYILQELFRNEYDIRSFSALLQTRRVYAPLLIMGSLGMTDSLIAEGTKALNKATEIGPFDCHGLTLLCLAYIDRHEYEKCLETLKLLKEKLAKRPQAADDTPEEFKKKTKWQHIYNNIENNMNIIEAESLLRMEKYSPALDLTVKVLNRPYHSWWSLINCFECNIRCSLMLRKFDEALRSIRDLSQIYQKKPEWYHSGFTPEIIQYIIYCLIGLGDKEQALHWARVGLNFVTEFDLTNVHIMRFKKLVERAKFGKITKMELYTGWISSRWGPELVYWDLPAGDAY